MLPRICHLTLTHGMAEFEFTEEALVWFWIYSALVPLLIVRGSTGKCR
jgi:hypothetical protein